MEGMNGSADMEGMQEIDNNTDMDNEERVSEHTFIEGLGEKERTTNMDACEVMDDEFIPECEQSMKPYLGQRFETIDEGVHFYKQYAAEVGFDVRCSTMRKTREGEVGVKYLLCSREGHRVNTNEGDKRTSEGSTPNLKIRRRMSNRVGCKARCGLRRQNDGYYAVNVFQEIHNHHLSSELAKPFLKINRKLNIGHQAFIATCAKANIGTSKAFELYGHLTGGIDNIGATCVDFRNCRRDVHAHLHEADAQAVIDKYTQKQSLFPTYTFEYDVDEENRLRRVFWADPTAKQNYIQFGDVVSFDATYRTNRYKLVFVPFTGIDNHKKCVTFGAGLIAREDIPSYVWLLNAFRHCMGHTPTCIITDQDPAMKVAIPQVFPEARHRFCMWHIMSKVGEKVGVKLAKDEMFRKKLNALVWNESLGREEFEVQWQALMTEYKLREHRWFTQMFDGRANWIEAYFSGVFMGGLMRTTSRSEAENGLFGSCINIHGSLLEFFTQFESVIEMQRHKQARLVADCEASLPTTKTPLRIEKHAASVYTIAIFYDVQTEIYEACFSCKITSKGKEQEKFVYTIKEGQTKSFEVKYIIDSSEMECSCGKFNRVGILCRHVFVVLKDEDVEMIPPKYILRRWTKNAVGHKTNDACTGQMATHSKEAEESKLAAKLWNEFYSCIALSKGNTTAMQEMLNFMHDHKGRMLKSKEDAQVKSSSHEVLQTFYGTQPSSSIKAKPPQISKNKGSGKRLKSNGKKQKKRKRKPGAGAIIVTITKHITTAVTVHKKQMKHYSRKTNRRGRNRDVYKSAYICLWERK